MLAERSVPQGGQDALAWRLIVGGRVG